MKNFEKFQHEPKKSDKAIIYSEALSDAQYELSLEFEQLQDDMDHLFHTYYPGALKVYISKKPDFDKLLESFESSRNAFSNFENVPEENGTANDVIKINEEYFLAATAIRYVDDFIDEAIRLTIPDNKFARKEFYQDPKQRKKFELFLEDALAIVRKYDPNISREIIRLPLLEYDLEANPNQAFFNEHYEELIEYKSYDMWYIHTLLTKKAEPLPRESLFYRIIALADLFRDFAEEDSLDFNIKDYLEIHEIDCLPLISYIQKIIDNLAAMETQLLPEQEIERGKNQMNHFISTLNKFRKNLHNNI